MTSKEKRTKSKIKSFLIEWKKKHPRLVLAIKSSIWLFFTLFFGLFQIWLILAKSYVVISEVFPFEELVKDGVLLFFVTAMVSSITLDYILSKGPSLNWNWFDVFMFVVYPFLIILICVSSFYVVYGEDVENININLLWGIQQLILYFTLLYAFIVKIYAFSECQIKTNNQVTR